MRSFTVAMLIGAAFTVWGLFFSAPAQADTDSYLKSLEMAGYYGPIWKWMTIGNTVCTLESEGYSESAIAYAIMMNTGPGIYMESGYEVISIANSNLCGVGESGPLNDGMAV